MRKEKWSREKKVDRDEKREGKCKELVDRKESAPSFDQYCNIGI